MKGFDKLTYTKIPNSLFETMKDMDECELKVLLYVCRMTFGYHRDEIKVSTRKIAEAIGISVASVDKGGDAAVARGLLERVVDGNKTTLWRALVGDSESESQVIQNLNHHDSESESLLGIKESIKEKERKPDFLDGIIRYQLRPKAIRDAMATYFKLTPNWEAKYNRQWMEWAVSIEMTAEQVEGAASLWQDDKRFNWRSPELKSIQEHWLELHPQRVAPIAPDTDGGYR